MSVWHRFCLICKHILTLGEMEKNDGYCDKCREHNKEFHEKFDLAKEEQ
jgi:hypothetical protein